MISALYTFSNHDWVPLEPKLTTQPRSYEQLKVVTYNVHFEKQEYLPRMKAVLSELQQQEGDIVCLQEMLHLFLSVFLEDPWVQQHYALSDISGDTLVPYGTLLMTKLQENHTYLRVVPFKTRMNRQLLVLHTIIHGKKINFATAHFESLEFSKRLRSEQFQTAMDSVRNEQAEAAVIVGDFNMCDEIEEDLIFPVNGFHDCWSMLRPDDPGYTMGVNYPHPKYRPIRFDRVKLWNSPNETLLSPIAIETFGEQRIKKSHMFPSDHLGIATVFMVQK